MHDALTRLRVMSEDPVRLFCDKEAKKLEITSTSPEAGQGREVLKIGIGDGCKDGEVVLSVNHLLDFLGVNKSEWMTLGYSGQKTPALMQPEDKTDLLAVLMPIADNT